VSKDETLVSIVICTYNGAQNLPETLASLSRVDVPPGLRAELLVVDNGSTDRTPGVVRSVELPNTHVRCIREPSRGKSYAYNTGLDAAQGEIILCTDDDIRFPQNWIKGMCEPIRSGRAHAVAGGIRLVPRLERPWMTPFHRGQLGSTEHLDRMSVSTMYGANMSFSRVALARVRSFDTTLGPVGFGTHEETLFSLQLVEAGCNLVSAFDVVVEHCASETLLCRSAFLERARSKGRSWAYIAHHWEHRTIDAPIYLLLWHMLHLARQRVTKRAEWFDWLARAEGAPVWELSAIEAIAFYRQYLAESKRRRNYTKRGLEKLAHL
jgi:glycosyltransferase involved in cell wall biosynthesis